MTKKVKYNRKTLHKAIKAHDNDLARDCLENGVTAKISYRGFLSPSLVIAYDAKNYEIMIELYERQDKFINLLLGNDGLRGSIFECLMTDGERFTKNDVRIEVCKALVDSASKYGRPYISRFTPKQILKAALDGADVNKVELFLSLITRTRTMIDYESLFVQSDNQDMMKLYQDHFKKLHEAEQKNRGLDEKEATKPTTYDSIFEDITVLSDGVVLRDVFNFETCRRYTITESSKGIHTVVENFADIADRLALEKAAEKLIAQGGAPGGAWKKHLTRVVKPKVIDPRTRKGS